MGPLYRLDELGWLQFERVCALVVGAAGGVGELDWVGHADTGRVAFVDRYRWVGDGVDRLEGPVTVVVVWAREGESVLSRAARMAQRVAACPSDLGFPFMERVLVVTNVDGVCARQALSEVEALAGLSVVVWGEQELAERIDRYADVRAAMPSVLGLRDLSGLIAPSVLGRSSLDVERAQALARVFWPTGPFERAREVLGRYRFVVLTGPPEMGKTAIAVMLGLALMSDGWEAHECTSPDQLWRVFAPGRRQVFIADDAFGSTEYRPDAAERWGQALGRLLAMLDEDHWLIWTSRPAPLRAGLRRVQRERGAERFPAPGQVLVDAGDLDLAEKTLILFRHAKARQASAAARDLVRSSAVSIVEHPHFTPERIRRFVADRIETLPQLLLERGLARMRTAVERELALPTEAMRTSFRALADEHRELLIALLDAPAGLIDERALIATVRRHYGAGLSRPPDQLIDRLTDHFLRVTPLGIGWVHPSWRDLVIDELATNPAVRHRFLGACGVDGVMLALSREGGAAGQRALPLLDGDEDWDHLSDAVQRLLRELEDHDLARVLLALRDALSERLGEQRTEAEALARSTLYSAARRWDLSRRPLTPFLLEAWYSLDERAPPPTAPPRLDWTWAELHPASPGPGELDRHELVLAEEWLGLAQTLARYDPEALVTLGFYGSDQRLLADLIAALRRTTRPDVRPIAESILARIEHIAPEHREAAVLAIAAIDQAGQHGPDWWTPTDLTAPPTTERVMPGPIQFTRADIDRVLADL
jgi:hypothetical protein